MSQQESWLSQYWYVLLPLIVVGIFMSVLVFGLIGFQNEMQKAREELQKTLAEERKHWDSLDCAGKHEYLQGKDLSGNRIFYTNQNEDLYREYVINCLPPEIAKEIHN